MNDKNLKELFNGFTTKMNYDDGKQLRVYITRDDFASICLDGCLEEKDENNLIHKYKTTAMNVVNLISWIKGNDELSGKIDRMLSRYLMYDVGFSISYDGKININYMGVETHIDPHDIIHFPTEDKVVAVLMNAAGKTGRKKMSCLEAGLPSAISESAAGLMDEVFREMVMSSDAWSVFCEQVKSIYILFNQTVGCLQKDRFRFQNESRFLKIVQDIIKTLDASNMQVVHKDREKNILIGGLDMFRIARGNVYALYDMHTVEKFKYAFSFIQKIHFDLMRAISPCKADNLCFRIDDKEELYIHNYTGSVKADSLDNVYRFVERTKEKIIFAKQGDMDEKTLNLLSVNDAGILKQCMDTFGKVDVDSYIRMAALRGMDAKEAVTRFSSVINIISKMKQCGVVEDWFLNGGSYEISFKKESILDYECAESHDKMYEHAYSLQEMIDIFPKEYIKRLLSESDFVYKNTKDILTCMDMKSFCIGFGDVLKESIRYMDTKYMLLLKLKVMRTNAAHTIGSELCKKINEFLKDC